VFIFCVGSQFITSAMNVMIMCVPPATSVKFQYSLFPDSSGSSFASDRSGVSPVISDESVLYVNPVGSVSLTLMSSGMSPVLFTYSLNLTQSPISVSTVFSYVPVESYFTYFCMVRSPSHGGHSTFMFAVSSS